MYLLPFTFYLFLIHGNELHIFILFRISNYKDFVLKGEGRIGETDVSISFKTISLQSNLLYMTRQKLEVFGNKTKTVFL